MPHTSQPAGFSTTGAAASAVPIDNIPSRRNMRCKNERFILPLFTQHNSVFHANFADVPRDLLRRAVILGNKNIPLAPIGDEFGIEPKSDIFTKRPTGLKPAARSSSQLGLQPCHNLRIEHQAVSW
jgi:hypothetical protein